MTRFTAKFRAEGRNDLAAGILKSGFIFRFIVSVISSLLCYLSSDLLATYILNRPDMGILIKFSSVLILLQALFNFLGESFIGLDKMQGNAIILNVSAFVKMALSSLLLILGFGVFGALVGYVFSFIFAVLVGGVLFLRFYKNLGKPSRNNFFENIKGMVSYGYPLYASGFISTAFSQVQILILALFSTNVEIGNFNVTLGLLTLVGVLTYPFSTLFPAFSKVKCGSYELNSLFKLSVKYTAILVVPVALLVSILSKDIVFTFYGRTYTSAPLFLSIYVLTQLYAGFGNVIFGHLFNGIGETKFSLYSNLINFIVFLPLAYILANSYGIFGFLIAIITSNTCSVVYSLWAAITKVHVKFDWGSSLRIYLASFLATTPILILANIIQFYYRFLNLVFYVPVFALLYLSLLPVVGAIDKSDLENMRMLFRDLKIIKPVLNLILRYESRLLSIFSKER